MFNAVVQRESLDRLKTQSNEETRDPLHRPVILYACQIHHRFEVAITATRSRIITPPAAYFLRAHAAFISHASVTQLIKARDVGPSYLGWLTRIAWQITREIISL